MNMPRIITNEFIRVLKAKQGHQSLVAEALGITQQAVSKRIKKNKKIKAAYDEIRTKNVDMAEAKLLEKVKEGSEKSIFYFLKYQGRDRGYGIERTELANADGENIDFGINWISSQIQNQTQNQEAPPTPDQDSQE